MLAGAVSFPVDCMYLLLRLNDYRCDIACFTLRSHLWLLFISEGAGESAKEAIVREHRT
jgi:hypothetical protein